jgi:hypothetical protein
MGRLGGVAECDAVLAGVASVSDCVFFGGRLAVLGYRRSSFTVATFPNPLEPTRFAINGIVEDACASVSQS